MSRPDSLARCIPSWISWSYIERKESLCRDREGWLDLLLQEPIKHIQNYRQNKKKENSKRSLSLSETVVLIE